MKHLFTGILKAACLLIPSALLMGTTASSITQLGITWHFDQPYTVGQYVNGDYWVLGPVTLTSITPDPYVDSSYFMPRSGLPDEQIDRHMNGWEINPKVRVASTDYQGFDRKISHFDLSKMPSLPITISEHNTSVVKVISRDCTNKNINVACYPALEAAAVLTVVTQVPPANQFRPTYTGNPSEKIVRTLAQINYAALPNTIDKNIPHPSFQTLLDRQKPLKFEHLVGNQMQSRPRLNMNNYLPYASIDFGEAILFVMSNEDTTLRHELLTHILQHGLDWIGLLNQGYFFPRGGGEMTAAILVPTFTAAVFNCEILKGNITTAVNHPDASRFPYEIGAFQISRGGIPLFGKADSRPTSHWGYFYNKYGSKTVADPHHYIDGGNTPGLSYQGCCTSGTWKMTVLIFNLFPQMKEVWYYQPMESYIQRWVKHGTWTLPDPCAPYDGVESNYGITWGPDPLNPGDCIKGGPGLGRFGELHGTNRNTASGTKSAYAERLWDTYYSPNPDTPPFAAIIFPGEGTSVHSIVPIEVSAYAIHDISSVQFFLNGNPLGNPVTQPVSNYPEGRTPPYAINWNSTAYPNGPYALSARATDTLGNTFLSASVMVALSNSGNHPPSLNPIGNRSVSQGQTLELTVNASDVDGDTLQYSASGSH